MQVYDDAARRSISQYIVRAQVGLEKLTWNRDEDTQLWTIPQGVLGFLQRDRPLEEATGMISSDQTSGELYDLPLIHDIFGDGGPLWKEQKVAARSSRTKYIP